MIGSFPLLSFLSRMKGPKLLFSRQYSILSRFSAFLHIHIAVI
jgi:hypothetical protein